MTIHQIECFLEAARTLNFTEAANHLYISQQGLSRQIASLEKELELRLFDRTTRDVRLTCSGELLLWRWKDIPKEIYDSVDMAREEGERAKRRINLSVVGMSGIIEMAGNILADYMAFDPEVEFEINEFTNIKDITNGNPDLMMTVSFTPSYEQLKEKCGLMVIKKLPLYYVMSKKNPLAQKEDVVMEDFKGETMLCLFKNFFAGAELRLFELIAKQEHVLQKARYYENVNSLELAIIANEGIHIGFKEFYHNYGERLVMHPMPNSRNQAYASVIIVWRKENEKRLESFIKFLKIIIINNNVLLIIRILVLDKKGGNCLKYKMVGKKEGSRNLGKGCGPKQLISLVFFWCCIPSLDSAGAMTDSHTKKDMKGKRRR